MPTELRARMLRTIDKAQLALALAGKVDYVYGYSFILTNLDVSTPAKLVGGTLSCAGCGIPAVNRCAFGVLEGVERVLSTSQSDTADTRADSNGAVEQSVTSAVTAMKTVVVSAERSSATEESQRLMTTAEAAPGPQGPITRRWCEGRMRGWGPIPIRLVPHASI